MKIIFSSEASRVLDQLEGKVGGDHLLKAIREVVDRIMDNTASAEARRRSLRTPRGHTVWMVPIPSPREDVPWVLLWQLHGEDIMVPYIGPEDFRPNR